jgi:membrane-associated phospholipid phosphatase
VTFISDFADQAVVLPLALAVGIALLAQGWRRGAAAWGLTIVCTFATMLVLKVMFLACWSSFGTVDLRTPSGHVAAATVVAGGLAALLLRRRASVLPLAMLAAGIIGISRLVLGVHSFPEVVLGASVGLGGALGLMLLAGRPPANIDAPRVCMAGGVVLVIFHGMHLPAEAHIRSTAWHLAQFLSVCQSEDERP